jgi:hypothetical protein
VNRHSPHVNLRKELLIIIYLACINFNLNLLNLKNPREGRSPNLLALWDVQRPKSKLGGRKDPVGRLHLGVYTVHDRLSLSQIDRSLIDQPFMGLGYVTGLAGALTF